MIRRKLLLVELFDRVLNLVSKMSSLGTMKMMKRFSRKRRSASSEGQRRTIDVKQWFPKLLEAEILDAKGLEPSQPADVPDTLAAIGRGERADGSAILVAFSPRSATEALLGGLAAADQAADESAFSGTVFVVAPEWPVATRRILSLLGRARYSIEPVAAPGLSDARVIVEAETELPVLATGSSQLAARMSSSESRAAFTRAAAALEGLAAKHGGTVRATKDRLELVVLARRAAQIRVDGDSPLLEVQLGGRQTTALTATDLAGALDGLEGQIRKRLNDRKVRDSEEGLRGRVVDQLSVGDELRGLRPWPQPGTDLAQVDAVAVNSEGEPVIVAIREEFEWTALAAVLESMGGLSSLFPVLFADVGAPLRLGPARLLLVGERFAVGLERALGALTMAYEIRSIAGTGGRTMDLVSRGAGEGAEARSSRRGRRRGGRNARSAGTDNGGRSAVATDELSSPPASDVSDASDLSEGSGARSPVPTSGPTGLKIPLGPRADLEASDDRIRDEDGHENDVDADGSGEAEDRGRGRGRRRRRSRRTRAQGPDGEDATESLDAEVAVREDVGSDTRLDGEAGRRRSRRFEEISLMDLDDTPLRADAETDGSESSGGRSRRGRRRGRRGHAEGESRSESRGDPDDPGAAPRVEEEDLVDSDDLEEILARLADDVPDDLETSDSTDLPYDDDDEIDADSNSPRGEQERIGAGANAASDASDDGRVAQRRRSAIVVHADRDSLISAMLLARDIRQIDGIWVYPQNELMTFFRSVATDLHEDTPILLIGFSPSPAREIVQASSLYRGRITWFDRHVWPPEDLMALREALGAEAIRGGVEVDSCLPLVLESSSRRSRFSDKLVDLATGRFTQHDFERWGRLWWWRMGEIAKKTGDIRADIAPIISGRPSDLTKEAALIDVPPVPDEVGFVASADFRLVHFGGHVMVVVPVEEPFDLHLSARIARERYSATLSLAYRVGGETFVLAGDETIGKRALDYMAVAEHLANKLEWVEARPDADHVARFRVRDFSVHPERLEELMGEIAMGRALLER